MSRDDFTLAVDKQAARMFALRDVLAHTFDRGQRARINRMLEVADRNVESFTHAYMMGGEQDSD
jgi:hypothetical protein